MTTEKSIVSLPHARLPVGRSGVPMCMIPDESLMDKNDEKILNFDF